MSPIQARIVRLGLPLRAPAHAWITAAALFVIYAATMARDLTFYDSPELALVADQLGVGHPVGMPLHTLLGHVFSRLTAQPHIGLTLMSALFGALCTLPAWSLADQVEPAAGRGATLRAITFVGVGASLVAWEPSTRVEVYSLAVFLSLFGCALSSHRPGFVAGLMFGLAACANVVISVAHALAVLPALLGSTRSVREEPEAEETGTEETGTEETGTEETGTEETGTEEEPPAVEPSPARRGWRAVPMTVAGGLAGLSLYALLPIWASDPRRFAWGAPRDVDSMVQYLRGADYGHNQGISWFDWSDHVGQLLGWAAAHGVLPIAIVGGLSLVFLAARGRMRWILAIAGSLLIAFVASNVIFHPDVPDYRGYFLGPLWLTAGGIALLSENLFARGGRFRAYGAAIAALPALALLVSYGHLTRVRDQPSLARVLASAALEEAPENAIIVVSSDHLVAPLLYLQEVEGQRPDVVVLATGLSSSGWYWDHIYVRHPSLREFELTVPGDDRVRRMRRFLAAQYRRRVLFEHVRLAVQSGQAPCGVGTLVWSRPANTRATTCGDPGPDSLTAAIEAAAPFRAESLEVAARVGEARGEALWRLGFGASAFTALTAGLHRSGVGPGAVNLPERAAPLGGALPDWRRPAALHDPARNVALAGLLLSAAGRGEHALRFINAAVDLGLTQAAVARTQLSGRPY